MDFLFEAYNYMASNPDVVAYSILGLKILADATKNGKDDSIVSALDRIAKVAGIEVSKYKPGKEKDKEKK